MMTSLTHEEQRPGFRPDGLPLSGTEVIARIREETDTILLSFSCGKDSIAAWLALQGHFKIIPFYMYLVPGLEFVERSLSYYERYFGTHIHRLPSPSLYRMLANLTFQAPERASLIEAARLPQFSYDDVSRILSEDAGSTDTLWTATGVRAADSPNRRTSIRQYGPINWNRRYFYPVWDMLKDELIAQIASSGVGLPIDYEWFGRSFDGIDYRFMSVLRDVAPDDYRRIVEWFPLCELELVRYEGIAAL